ncbi:MAG TPA: hypothetical protein G4N92_09330 [Anaerolineae bacterium]|nr:hypothetical protein [Anaerolineae bacterium]
MKKELPLLAVIITVILFFIFFSLPNSRGAKDEHMLFILSQDENIQYPYLKKILTPKDNLISTIRNFVGYGHYYYGYPFYVSSALSILPVRVFTGSESSNLTQLNLYLLRQIVSVTPLLLSIGVMVYLQTKFQSTIKSIILFLFIAFLPWIFKYNLWFWHPDALAALGIVLTIFFLEKDNFKFGKFFLFAAVTCGFVIATKVIGVFFFLAIMTYLIMGLIKKTVGFKKLLSMAFTFLIIMIAVMILLNPLLLVERTRRDIIDVQKNQYFYVTKGWENDDLYETGINAWLPYLNDWFVYPQYLGLLLLLLVLGCFFGNHKLTNVLILAWIIPYSAYLIYFVAIKPYQYWLPIAIPFFSSAINLMPNEVFEKGGWKNLSNKRNIHILALSIIQIITIVILTYSNVVEDWNIWSKTMDKEPLLLACNSTPENTNVGEMVFLNEDYWYLVESFDNRISPNSYGYQAMKGPYKIVSFSNYGEKAWKCMSEDAAIFSAAKHAKYLKIDYPHYVVYGPDDNEIK